MAFIQSRVVRRLLSTLCTLLLLFPSGLVLPVAAHAQGSPHFKVNPDNDSMWGHEWTASFSVTVTIGSLAAPDFQDTVPTDENGDWTIGELGYDVQVGETVTVDDGVTTKVLVVSSLAVTSVDPAADIVYGVAEPGAELWVAVHGEVGYGRTVTADGNGDWSADFSVSAGPDPNQAMYDIVPGDSGFVEDADVDGDITWADWRVPAPNLAVNPNADDVWGGDWPAYITLDIYVGDPGSPAHHATADTDEWGNFGTHLEYDVASGDSLTVTDGATTKTHDVTSLTVDGVDPDTDTVWGTAAPGSNVQVDAWGMAWRHVDADGAGNWSVDFSIEPAEGQGEGTADIGPGTEGEARQQDEDMDSTAIGWRVPDTYFRVNPHSNDVWGGDWAPDSSVDIYVGDPGNPAHTESAQTGGNGDFGIMLQYDVVAGDTITVTDGTTEKTTIATPLTLDGVDPDADIVWGTAEPGSQVQVHGGDGDWVTRSVTADASTGEWLADFAVSAGPDWQDRAFDIQRGSQGEAVQYDDDMDGTEIPWRVRNSAFKADPHNDNVWGWDWLPDSTVDIYVGDPGSPDHSETAQTDGEGNFGTGIGYDLVPGDLLTVDDGTIVKSTVLTSVAVGGVDPDTDTVWGTAAPGADVQVDITNTGIWRVVTADGSGDWAVDFSFAGGPEEWQQPFDISRGTDGEATEFDEDWDGTSVPWRVPDTGFNVNPENEDVWGWEWTPESTLDIYVGDPGMPDQHVTASVDWDGGFYTNLDYDVATGDLVTVTDGVTTKEHLVTSLAVDGVDPDTDTVWGTAAPGSEVQVDVYGMAWRVAIADGTTGEWSASFANPPAEGEGDGTCDIGRGTEGEARQYDEDNDGTAIQWRVPDTSFNVNPNDESVWGWEWEPNGVVTITVGDLGTPDHEAVFPLSEWGDFGTNLEYDLMAGETVTVSDGTTTKSHVITGLTVDGVDPDTDTVWGYAEPGTQVQVDAWGMAWRWVTADETTGEWIADFANPPAEGEGDNTCDIGPGTEGEARQPDEDNDGTAIPWRVPDTSFRVNPNDEGVWGWDWEPNATVDIYVGDPGTPDHHETAQVDDWGNFGTGLGYDIVVGDLVTVTDGTSTKDTIVTDLAVDGVDPDTDTVWGTADPGTDVMVHINQDWGAVGRWVTADGTTGEWLADFTDPAGDGDWDQAFDIGPGTEGAASQIDEDNDGTEVGWRVPDTTFNVNPNDESVWGWEWEPNGVVTITVGDLGTPDHEAVFPLGEWGDFGTNLEYDLMVGETVTVSDGTTTKSHVITGLTVDGVDPDTDTVWGYAEPGTQVQVDAWGMAWRWVTADETTGEWIADFANPPAEGEGDNTCDIGPGTEGEARQPDEDNDGTAIPWRVPDTSFRVNPNDEGVWGWDWEPNATVDIYVGDPGTPDHHETAQVDDWGNFGTGLGYDIVVGDLVTVTDGTSTKDTIVTDLAVDGVDPDTDTVWGTADPGTDVMVHINQDWGAVGRWVTADGTTGEWLADFTDPAGDGDWDQAFDIGPGTEGAASQIDEDNDGTEVGWRVPDTTFNVNPNDESVWGWEWEPNGVVTITVGDLGTPDHEAVFPLGEWGDFGTNLEYDLMVGETVTVSDGTTTKSHVITGLTVDGVDPDTDTVWGYAEPGTQVQVDAWGMAWRWVTADETTGEWTADFANPPAEGEGDNTCDIGPGTEGEARQPDEDNDGTAIPWRLPNPQFVVEPLESSVDGWDWPVGATIDVFLGDPGSPDAQAQTTVDEWGSFWVDLGFEVGPGDVITVTDGMSSKATTVTNLVVDGVDPDTDTVWGTADPGAEVQVQIYTEWGQPGRWVTADETTGEWLADFSAPVGEEEEDQAWDIGPGTDGRAYQWDEDADATAAGWRVPISQFMVNPDFDEVEAWEFEPNSTVDIFVGDPASSDYATSTPTDDSGSTGPVTLDYDIATGDLITVTDGSTTKDHAIMVLTIESIDPANDIVTGTAEPGMQLQVNVWDVTGEHSAQRLVLADETTGEWTADFSTAVGAEDWEQAFDLQPGDTARAEVWDDDWDSTWAQSSIPNPRFWVAPWTDTIGGTEWLPDTTLDITVKFLGTPVHTTTALTDSSGDFSAAIGMDVINGDELVVSDGVTTKSHVITPLSVTDVDVTADTVSGVAAGGTDVVVRVSTGPGSWVERMVTADVTTNEWIADFSEGVVTHDLIAGDQGHAAQDDDDGDSTVIDWLAEEPPVNTPPVAVADSYQTDEDVALTVVAPGVLANDSDADSDPLTVELVSDVTHGTLALSANGGFVYTPAADYNGPDSFTYRAYDGEDYSNAVTVSITVNAVNDAPVAVADSYSTNQGVTLNVPAPGVLHNDHDPEGGSLEADLVSDASHGTLALSETGAFEYTPDADFTGTDTFMYCCCDDGPNYSNAVTVTIVVEAVNEAPVAVSNGYSTTEGIALSVAAPGVLGNDTDADGNALTAHLVTGVSFGTLVLSANGGFVYTPAEGFAGIDTFTYRAHDGEDYSNTVTVTIDVEALPVVPIEGPNRFDTAIEASLRAYPTGLDPNGKRTVVIATGRNWPDALGGASLAGAMDGPVLLVDTSVVPEGVLAEITRLGAVKAIILGGSGAVGIPVENALKTALGAGNVERIGGSDRYGTANLVATRVIAELGAGYDGKAFVATGGNFPDALAAAPLAASKNWPLYLAHPAAGLTPATRAAMAGVESALILGGTGVVSPAVESYLVSTYGAGNVTRLAGPNRYATAVAVATYGVNSAGLSWDRAGIATGENFPDALAGGVTQGQAGSVMLLSHTQILSPETRAALVAHKAEIDSVSFYGGPGAVSQAVRDAVAAALQ